MKRTFTLTLVAALQFILLTVIAMFLYAGGTAADAGAAGYNFFQNFFSDLGRTVAHTGTPNYLSAVLFFLALGGAGVGLAAFFTVAPRLCGHRRSTQILAVIGSIFGVIAGLSYVGIAFTPADLLLEPHTLFVYGAFGSFLVAVLFYAAAIYLTPSYPNRYAAVYLVFAVLLSGYLTLLFAGPRGDETALTVQATGQKIIVYAAIITVVIQAYGARQLAGERSPSPAEPPSAQAAPTTAPSTRGHR